MTSIRDVKRTILIALVVASCGGTLENKPTGKPPEEKVNDGYSTRVEDRSECCFFCDATVNTRPCGDVCIRTIFEEACVVDGGCACDEYTNPMTGSVSTHRGRDERVCACYARDETQTGEICVGDCTNAEGCRGSCNPDLCERCLGTCWPIDTIFRVGREFICEG